MEGKAVDDHDRQHDRGTTVKLREEQAVQHDFGLYRRRQRREVVVKRDPEGLINGGEPWHPMHDHGIILGGASHEETTDKEKC